MDTSIHLFRKRHIPKEYLSLDQDEILSFENNRMITRWTTLKPREDFASGVSVYEIAKHWKITKILKADGTLHQWYCDIMNFTYDKESSTCVMEDLLIDVILSETGELRVVDLDEAAEAFEKGLISANDLTTALYATDELLRLIYSGEFKRYQTLLDEAYSSSIIATRLT